MTRKKMECNDCKEIRALLLKTKKTEFSERSELSSYLLKLRGREQRRIKVNRYRESKQRKMKQCNSNTSSTDSNQIKEQDNYIIINLKSV